MVIYKEHLIYLGLGLVVLIILGFFTIKHIQRSPGLSETSQKEVHAEKPPTDDTINSFTQHHYPNAGSTS